MKGNQLMTVYWSWPSMALYICMGLISMKAVSSVKGIEYKQGRKVKLINTAYTIWLMTWAFITVFRKVDYNIGGSDAIAYVNYFQDCLIKNLDTLYAHHLDKGFQLVTKCVRLITAEYRIYFLVIYTVIILAYIYFINEIAPSGICYEPMILIFFVYLRGFTTIRTNISNAFFLIALVSLYKKDKIKTLFFFVLSLGMHIASFWYAPFFVFYYLYYNKKLKLSKWVGLYGGSLVGAKVLQQLLIKVTSLRGAYASYAAKSLNSSFFSNGWKIAFGQILLLVSLVAFNRCIQKSVNQYIPQNRERYRFIFLLCAYDFLMIPVNYILGIWRGYENLYIPRLIMWGILMQAISNCLTAKSKYIFRAIMLIAFMGWMVFRIEATYNSSCLMPYIFDF